MKGLLKGAVLLGVAALAACGGGGGGGGGGVGPPPGPTVVNTSSVFYLPWHAGNRWAFNSGGSFNDAGRYTTSCSCAINGLATEGMEIHDTSGNYSSTFFFSKTPSSQTSGTMDSLIGISNDRGATVSLVTDGVNYGLAVNDSAAFVGEHWTNSGETSTITAVNGTQAYGSNGIITNMNTDQFTGAQLNLSWGFAKGVGFTFLTMSGSTITLASFTVDAVNSQSAARSPSSRTMRATGTVGTTAALSQLHALF